MSQMSLPLIRLAGSEGKAVKSGYLSFQYGILGNKEVKLYTKWRSNNAFCASGNLAVCFVTGSCCQQHCPRYTHINQIIILPGFHLWPLLLYSRKACKAFKLQVTRRGKVQDCCHTTECDCLLVWTDTAHNQKKIEPMLSYWCKLVKEV